MGGDLTDWRTGEWCTIPAATLGLGPVVLGLPGTGKTETLLRLAQVALAGGYDVHIIDAKGDPHTQARFAIIAATAGHQTRLFPQEPYDGWRGDPTALRNRLAHRQRPSRRGHHRHPHHRHLRPPPPQPTMKNERPVSRSGR